MSTVALSITICLTLICAPSCPATAQTSAFPPQEQAFRNVPKAVRCGSLLTVHLLSLLSDEDTLDELPQFFNVLRGNMSVVGPRPERPHFVKRCLDEISRYDSRHRLKVGITGWVQVKGWVERQYFDTEALRIWPLLPPELELLV